MSTVDPYGDRSWWQNKSWFSCLPRAICIYQMNIKKPHLWKLQLSMSLGDLRWWSFSVLTILCSIDERKGYNYWNWGRTSASGKLGGGVHHSMAQPILEWCVRGPPCQPPPLAQPIRSKPMAVAPSSKALVVQSTPLTHVQKPRIWGPSCPKASSHQARPQIQTNNLHMWFSGGCRNNIGTSGAATPAHLTGPRQKKQTNKANNGAGR